MGLAESLIFYLLIGLGVSAAVWLSTENRSGAQRLFPTATAVLFWPIRIMLRKRRKPAAPTATVARDKAS